MPPLLLTTPIIPTRTVATLAINEVHIVGDFTSGRMVVQDLDGSSNVNGSREVVIPAPVLAALKNALYNTLQSALGVAGTVG